MPLRLKARHEVILDTKFFKTGDLILQSKKHFKRTLSVQKKVPTELGFNHKSCLLFLIKGVFFAYPESEDHAYNALGHTRGHVISVS